MSISYSISPLASAYLAVVLAAQDAERALAATRPAPARPLSGCESHTALPADDVGSDGIVGQSAAREDPPLTEEEILGLALERGLAEIVHLTTMPAARSTAIPLRWEEGLRAATALEPETGAANALRAVSRHVCRAPKR